MFITGVNITGVNDTGYKFIGGVNDTGDNPCHGFSVIAGVVDTGNKFLTDTSKKCNAEDNNTGEQLSPVMTRVNNYRR
jgi:hypothetical protein